MWSLEVYHRQQIANPTLREMKGIADSVSTSRNMLSCRVCSIISNRSSLQKMLAEDVLTGYLPQSMEGHDSS